MDMNRINRNTLISSATAGRGRKITKSIPYPTPPTPQTPSRPILHATPLRPSFWDGVYNLAHRVFSKEKGAKLAELQTTFNQSQNKAEEVSTFLETKLGITEQTSLEKLTKEAIDGKTKADRIATNIEKNYESIKTKLNEITTIRKQLVKHANQYPISDRRVEAMEERLRNLERSLNGLLLLHEAYQYAYVPQRPPVAKRLGQYIWSHEERIVNYSTLARFLEREIDYLYAQFLANRPDTTTQKEFDALIAGSLPKVVEEMFKLDNPNGNQQLPEIMNHLRQMPIAREATRFHHLRHEMDEHAQRSLEPGFIASSLWRAYGGTQIGEYVAATYFLYAQSTDSPEQQRERLAVYPKIAHAYRDDALKKDPNADWAKDFFVTVATDAFAKQQSVDDLHQVQAKLAYFPDLIQGLHKEFWPLNSDQTRAIENSDLLGAIYRAASPYPKEVAHLLAAEVINQYADQIVQQVKDNADNPFAANRALLRLNPSRIEYALKALGLSQAQISEVVTATDTKLIEARQTIERLRSSPAPIQCRIDSKMGYPLEEFLSNERAFGTTLQQFASLIPQILSDQTPLTLRRNLESIQRFCTEAKSFFDMLPKPVNRLNLTDQDLNDLMTAASSPHMLPYILEMEQLTRDYDTADWNETNQYLKVWEAPSREGMWDTIQRNIQNLLILPIQRGPRWPMTLGALAGQTKKLGSNHPAKQPIEQLHAFAEEIPRYLNEMQNLRNAADSTHQ